MALPSNTFMFNYNAREYVPSTRTFPKTTGQLFDENLVLNADPAVVGKYYVDFTGKELYMRKMFSTTGDNPFNVTSTNPNLTFVCKTSDFSSSSANIFVSRSTATTHNCLIRGDRIILNTDYGVFVPTASPQIISITINSNGVLVRKELDASGNVITSVTENSVEFRNGSNGIAFFRGFADASREYFQNRFYWMYLSRETLTDEEILQVINHNEPKPIKIPYNNIYRNGVNLNYQQPKPHDYSKDYLTMNVLSGGTIEWIHGTGTTAMNIQYSKDNGANWTTISSTTAGTSISVDAGDKVIFKGSNSRYNEADNSQKRHAFLITGCTANVEGNIMSMIAGDNFTGATLGWAYAFAHLFWGCSGIISASNLIMPANIIEYCYLRMFQNCTSLTTAPVLPAPSLTTTCYGLMFGGCSSLTYIKCLATSGIDYLWSTNSWVQGVAATGTFVKKSGITWPTGDNGIPSGWTVQEV